MVVTGEFKVWTDVFLFSNFRCSQIMGRSEQDELTAAQILYPCMQCADIFFLKVLDFVILSFLKNRIIIS